MIKSIDDGIEMVFGTGDIGVNSGGYVESDEKVGGFVIFYNQEPRPIGSPGDISPGSVVGVNDFPVVMKFHKTESIDVLIGALLGAKNMMVNK